MKIALTLKVIKVTPPPKTVENQSDILEDAQNLNDIFISYAHIDNEALTEEDKGWISQFHKVLDTRVAQ